MKKNTSSMHCGTFYHIYNRGINGEDLFKEPRNYRFFLRQYAKYIHPVAETYAYCLMKNHFHLLVRTRGAEDVIRNVNVGRVFNPSDVIQNPSDVIHHKDLDMIANKHISNQFSKLFNSYTQSINKAYNRTSGLFEELFRRIPVENENYFVQLVYYIHTNPQKHKFVKDFREYPYSSYHTYLSKLDTKLSRAETLEWFGGVESFENFHLPIQVLPDLEKFEIEFD
jgi:REP element-mobilizing transposase RayT